MNGRGAKISLAAVSGLVLYFFAGVYSDREFGTHHLFLKHKPTPRFFFRAPVGESDRTLDSLAPDDRDAETAYRAFVEEGGGYRRSFWLFF